MKNQRIGLIIAALLLSAYASATELAPDWEMLSADGQKIRLSDEVEKQPVVLLFWASWCPYCKALMPHLQSIRLEYGDAVEILAISFRDKGDPVGFIRERGYEFVALPEGDAIAKMYEVHGTPGLFVIDGNRRITFDLLDLPSITRPTSGEKLSNSQKAAYLAPYWAAAIRENIDSVLDATE